MQLTPAPPPCTAGTVCSHRCHPVACPADAMRSALALLAAVAALSCLGGTSAALTPAQVQQKLTVHDRDIAGLKTTTKNLGDRVTAQGSRTTELNGRVNVLNNTIISINQKIKPLKDIEPSLLLVPDLLTDFAALRPLIVNNKAVLQELLGLPAKLANLTATVDKLAADVKSQNDSIADLKVSLNPLLQGNVINNLVSLSSNTGSLLSLADKSSALLGLLTIG
ncbi:hypothetical protein ABPG77_008711 [Micractinium sp. CCAP 211/92]